MSPHPGIPSPQVTGGRSALFPTQSVSTPKTPEGEFTRRRRCSRTKEDRQRRTKRRNTRAIEGVKLARRAQKQHSRSLPRTKGEVRRRDRVNVKTATPESGQVARPCQRRELTEGATEGRPRGPRPCTSRQRHPRGPASGGGGETQ